MPIGLEAASGRAASVGSLVVVRVPRRGRGKVVEILGPETSIDAVITGLLVHRGIRPVDGPSTTAEREAAWISAEPGAEGRVDLRKHASITIDPDDARDFDDAIGVSRSADGEVVAYVHIADVSACVHSATAVDARAEHRAFSAYVPGQVVPMLPEALSDDACSLRPGQDRPAVTVELAFDGNGRVASSTFYRSLIRSRARLTYTQAEEILAGRERAEPDVAEVLRRAQSVAAQLRHRRFARGALRLESPELTFTLDGEGGVAGAALEHEPAAHALVEEFMVAANEAVGAFLAQPKAPALFRVHERPDPQAVLGLLSRLAALEVPTPPRLESLTPAQAADLAAVAAEAVATYVRSTGRGGGAFPSIVLRSLQQARYDHANLGHSGLASAAYAHFTSPIRRYPDLVCHRSLLAELGLGDDPPPPDLDALAGRVSAREREIAAVEHAANDLCLAWLLDRRLFELGWEHAFDGEVVGVINSGLFVRFDGIFEGYLPARRIPGDYYELDPIGVALTGRRFGRTFRLGDSIQIAVSDIDRAEGKVSLALYTQNT